MPKKYEITLVARLMVPPDVPAESGSRVVRTERMTLVAQDRDVINRLFSRVLALTDGDYDLSGGVRAEPIGF